MGNSDRPGFFFCICPDSELIRQHIRRKLQERPEQWKRKVFWADEELPESFWESLTWKGLLGENTAVIVRRAEKLPDQVWTGLNSVLQRFQSRIWPFFCLEAPWEKGKPKIPQKLSKKKYWLLAKEKQWLWQSPGLNRNGVKQRISQWAKDKDVHISQEVLNVAADLLPLNASALENELQKLEHYTGSKRTVQAEDLGIISFQAELDIFSFLQAVQTKGKALEVWRQVFHNQLGSNADMVLPFLALMLREARVLWQLLCREGNKIWLPARVKEDKMRLAEKMGKRRLAQLWNMLLNAETGIKSGNYSPGQALDMVISELMLIFT